MSDTEELIGYLDLWLGKPSIFDTKVVPVSWALAAQRKVSFTAPEIKTKFSPDEAYQVIRRLIEFRPKVSRNRLLKWAKDYRISWGASQLDNALSALTTILREAGVEIEEDK